MISVWSSILSYFFPEPLFHLKARSSCVITQVPCVNRCYLVEELNPYRGLVPIPNLASSCPTLYPIKCSINNNTVSSINTQISEWHQFLQFSKLQLYCTEVWIHELNFSHIKGCVARSHWVGVLVDNWRMCLVPYAMCWDYLCGACFVLCVLCAEAHPVLCCGVFVFVCLCGGSNTSCAVLYVCVPLRRLKH